MKNVFGLLVSAIFILCAPSVAQAGNKLKGQRYVYCNVFAASICFGITQGESSRMTIPADFVVYDVALGNGLTAIVYSGRQPQPLALPPAVGLNEYTVPEGRVAYQPLTQGGYDFFFRPSAANLPITHVQFQSVTKGQEEIFTDFMRNIRACGAGSSGVACSESRIFSQAIDQMGL
ncbi:hypothetical protein [Montanilutibacter psychrotolerans]|uniref:hypothetical protein n=1 Tax=Montanilutibacter psychrotolerans TaxID=1327343 RepID=UPI0011CE7A46|nr:hypothetical protein [Lysobacter psychrotolerans]